MTLYDLFIGAVTIIPPGSFALVRKTIRARMSSEDLTPIERIAHDLDPVDEERVEIPESDSDIIGNFKAKEKGWFSFNLYGRPYR